MTTTAAPVQEVAVDKRTVALFIDDAAAARLALQPLLQSSHPAHVILVACAPKLTHHVGRFLTNASREQYRDRWARDLFGELQPLWSVAPRGTVETMVARAPLEVMVQRMRVRLGSELVAVDARRAGLEQARQGHPAAPQGAETPAQRWLVPAFVTSGLGIAIALAD
jgi:hypothetical protein